MVAALDGNVSVRLEGDRVLCTRTMVNKGFVTEDDLVIIDMSGKKVSGSGEPTSEMAMHLAAYKTRRDVQAVVHAHPPTAVAFTIAGVSLARCVLPEVVMTLHAIPTVPYRTTGTYDLADGLVEPLKRFDVVMMDRHGAVCVGPDLMTAWFNMEKLEHAAEITLKAHTLGKVQELPEEEVVRLKKLGEKYGVPGIKEHLEKAGHGSGAASEKKLAPQCVGCTGCNNPSEHGIGAPVNLRIGRLTSRPMAMGHGGIQLGMNDGLPRGGDQVQRPLPLGKDPLLDLITEEITRTLRGNG